mgnify:FL=1
MKPFQQLTSQAIPLNMDNVDTDMIIPAQFLTQVTCDGYGQHLFQRLREQHTDFVFNSPKYQFSAILIAKENFGCGSSREHAVWALTQAGIKAIIAQSYSDIFYNNAIKNGVLLISLTPPIIAKMIKNAIDQNFILTIDLEKQTVTTSED